jgi:hypothetical protein
MPEFVDVGVFNANRQLERLGSLTHASSVNTQNRPYMIT